MLLTPQTAVNRNQPLLKWFIFFPYNLIISSAQICGRSNELSHTAEQSGEKWGKQKTGVLTLHRAPALAAPSPITHPQNSRSPSEPPGLFLFLLS